MQIPRTILGLLALTGWTMSALPGLAAGTRFEMGGGPAALGTNLDRVGGGMFVSAGSSARPWLWLGARGRYLRFGPPSGYTSIPEAIPTFDDTRLLTLSAVARLEAQNGQRVAPFVEFEAGLGALRWGDVHVADMNRPAPFTQPGLTESGLCAGIGAGLTLHSARPWPEVQLDGRLLRLAGESRVRVLMPGIALRY